MSVDQSEATFPPRLAPGRRVWTQSGFTHPGQMEGPWVDIAPNQGGTITETQQPYYTRWDLILYSVRWDNGQVSKHYAKELPCIGRFQNRVEFEAAIRPSGTVRITVGPGGGFRHVDFDLEYDGRSETAILTDDGGNA